MRTILVAAALAALAACLSACATYRQDLNRGQRLYEENEYERALAIFRVLEHDTDSLSLNDQARYAFLRGMTDYRLGFRADARHWLALAKATEQEHPGGLSQSWKQWLEQALEDLNRDVYGGAESRGQMPLPGQPAAAPPQAPAQPVQPPAPAAQPQEPPLPAGTCTSTSDCAANQICQNNVCVAQ